MQKDSVKPKSHSIGGVGGKLDGGKINKTFNTNKNILSLWSMHHTNNNNELRKYAFKESIEVFTTS